MIPETSEAEEIFSNTFANSIRKFSAIFSFWRISRLGVPNVYTTIFNEAKDFNKDLFTNIVNAKFFHDQQAAFEFLEPLGGIENFSSEMARSEINTFLFTVDAASIIFAHSILDGAAYDYCRVTSIVDPNSWAEIISEKQIKLKNFKGKQYDDIVKEKVNDYIIKEVERKSLLFKVDKLFQICRPSSEFSPIKNFEFDRDRLLKLDILRHEIVHGSGPFPQTEAVDEKIKLLQDAGSYLMALVNMRYNLKIDPKDMLEVFKRKS